MTTLKDGEGSIVLQEKEGESPLLWFHVHGGGFGGGKIEWGVKVGRQIREYFGVPVVVCDFRKDTAQHAIEDIVATINREVCVNPGRKVVLSGSSSGGWFAHAAALQTSKLSCPIDALILMCPVEEPVQRKTYLYYCAKGEPMPASHAPPKGSPVREKAAAETILANQSMCTGLFDNPPNPSIPTLALIAGHDKNVPMQQNNVLMSWATTTVVLGRAGHDIQADMDKSQALNFMAEFLSDHIAL